MSNSDEIVNIINQTVVSIKNFATEQMPDVIQQLLLWKFWEHTIIGTLLVGLVVACVFVSRRNWNSHKMIHKDGVWIPLVIACLNAVPIFYSFSNAFQIWIAPKVWLIEYAAKVMAGRP